MATKNTLILLISLLALVLSSCEKILFEKDLATTDPFENFEYLWQQCDEKYSYFELKNINWYEVKKQYRAKLYKGMSNDSLFNVLGGMLTELKDDHTNLISSLNISFFGTNRLGEDNFDWRIVEENYLPRNYYISGPFRHDFLNGTNHEIAYVRFASFTGGVNASNLNFIINRYRNTKGLILDLRENGGGAVSDVYDLLSPFVEAKTLLFYSILKNGKEHNNFTAPRAAYLEPRNLTYTKPVMLLVDRGTYSAGSFTALATKAIPNITLMGDTTGGGLGLPNGGQLPNGWTYRFSVTQTLDLNMDNTSEQGVPPDIKVALDRTVLDKDEVIDRAIQEILNP